MNYIGTQTLETDRLILRRLELDDYEQAYENIYSNENIAKKTLWERHDNKEITRQLFDFWNKEYDNPDTYRWVITSKENNEVIGVIDTQENKYDVFGAYEVGYCLSEKYWNNGYMTEVLRRVIKFFMEEVKANVLFVESLSDNIPSQKVLEKVGMTREGVFRNRVMNKEGFLLDIITYSITASDYEKANATAPTPAAPSTNATSEAPAATETFETQQTSSPSTENVSAVETPTVTETPSTENPSSTI